MRFRQLKEFLVAEEAARRSLWLILSHSRRNHSFLALRKSGIIHH